VCVFLYVPGRLDRKIEFPHPTEEARARILQIHSRKMHVSQSVNYEELARCTDDFNGAQLKVPECVDLVSSTQVQMLTGCVCGSWNAGIETWGF